LDQSRLSRTENAFKKKNSGSQNFTSNEEDSRGSPTTSFCPWAIFGAPPVTTSIPVVFETGSDPIQLGLGASLNRPVGNVTGVTQLNVDGRVRRLMSLRLNRPGDLFPGAVETKSCPIPTKREAAPLRGAALCP
jgi:hypothetical protein